MTVEGMGRIAAGLAGLALIGLGIRVVDLNADQDVSPQALELNRVAISDAAFAGGGLPGIYSGLFDPSSSWAEDLTGLQGIVGGQDLGDLAGPGFTLGDGLLDIDELHGAADPLAAVATQAANMSYSMIYSQPIMLAMKAANGFDPAELASGVQGLLGDQDLSGLLGGLDLPDISAALDVPTLDIAEVPDIPDIPDVPVPDVPFDALLP